ncbi:MAG: hypothetical protein R3B09_10600 [Nannocystaceae bacterium]
MSRTSMRPRLLAAALLLAAPGCAKRSTETSAPEAERARGGDEGALDDYEAALADEERRLRTRGVAAQGESSIDAAHGGPDRMDMSQGAGSIATSPPEPGAPGPRRACAERCDLSTSICGLEVKICALAERHPDEPRYHQVCARASDDCANARTACDACR